MNTNTLTAQLQEQADAIVATAHHLTPQTKLRGMVDTLITTAVQRTREEAIKPYIDGIRQMARHLRAAGLTSIAQQIEDDLATLQTN